MNDDSFRLEIYKMTLQQVRTFVSVLYHVSLHLLQIIRTENFINSLMAYLSLILIIVLWSDHLAVWRREEDQNIWWRCPNTSYQPSRLIRASPLTKMIRNTISLDSEQISSVIPMVNFFRIQLLSDINKYITSLDQTWLDSHDLLSIWSFYSYSLIQERNFMSPLQVCG